MLRNLMLMAIAAVIASNAAALTLTGDQYSTTPGSAVPDSITLTMNGVDVPGCTLVPSVLALTPTCQLPALAPGSYTFVMSASVSPTCSTVGTSSQSCSLGGVVASAPFVLTILAPSAAPTGLKVAP